MILVTGTMGRIGTATVAALRASHTPVRAMVPTIRQVPWLAELDVELVEGDADDAGRLHAALDGVRSVVLIARPGAEQVALQERVIDACASSGVERLVKLSSAQAAPDARSDAARSHWRTEQHALRSGLETSIVRVGRTMQDVQLQTALLLAHQILVHCQGDGVAPDVDARDVGDVLAAVALGAATPGAPTSADPLLVTGGELLSRRDMADEIGRALGRRIDTVSCTAHDLAALLGSAGVPTWQAEDLVAYEEAAHDGHCAVLTDTVARWTGRPPRTFAAFANELAVSLRYTSAPGAMAPATTVSSADGGT